MLLKQTIQDNLTEALKKGEEVSCSTLRMLGAAILNREKEKRYRLSKEKPELKEKDLEKESQLTDKEILQVISSEIKKRKEAISEFEKGRGLQPSLHPARKKHIEDLAEKEKAEIEILEKYLPEQLSEEEIKKLAKEAIKKVRAKEPKDIRTSPSARTLKASPILGKVMQELMVQIKGKADGGMVSKIVKELLGA